MLCPAHDIQMGASGLLGATRERTARGLGIIVAEKSPTHLAWGDDTWLLGHSTRSVDVMLSELEERAARNTGLTIGWEKCTVMGIAPEPPQPEQDAENPT